MKKIISLLILVVSAIQLTSCGNDDATYVGVSPLEISFCETEFGAEGGSGTIVVNSAEPITATSEVEWLNTSVLGEKVSVAVAPNSKLTGRSGKITLKSASGLTSDVTITQKGNVFGWDGDDYLIVSDAGDTKNIDILHSQSVTVETEEEWIHPSVSSDGSQLIVTVDKNQDERIRFGYVTIHAGEVTDVIGVRQVGLLLNVKNTFLMKDAKGGFKDNIPVDHTQPVNVEAQDSWLKASFNEKTSSIEVTAIANDGDHRTGTILVTSGTKQVTVAVCQYDYETEVLGLYSLYYFENEWKSTTVQLVDNGDGRGSLEFLEAPYDTYGISIPVGIDRERMEITIGNFIPLSGLYTDEETGKTHKLMATVLLTDGEHVVSSQDKDLTVVGELELDEGDDIFLWNFDVENTNSFVFYGLRFALTTTGGADGYVANLFTFPGFLLEKVNE